MDAFQQHYWDLRQVLIWVLLGNRTLVQQCADDADWIVTDLTLDVAAGLRGGAALESRDEAERTVLRALQSSQIKAIGVRNGSGDPEEIPQLDCVNLKVYYGNETYPPELVPLDGVAPRGSSPPLGLGPPDPFRPGATYWHEVMFAREAVLSIWPDVLQGVADKDIETASAGSPSEETAHSGVGEGADEPPVIDLATTSRREKGKANTAAKYKRWYELAKVAKAEEGRQHPLRPVEIARKVESLVRKEDGSPAVAKVRGLNAENIQRRLREHFPGWSEYDPAK